MENSYALHPDSAFGQGLIAENSVLFSDLAAHQSAARILRGSLYAEVPDWCVEWQGGELDVNTKNIQLALAAADLGYGIIACGRTLERCPQRAFVQYDPVEKAVVKHMFSDSACLRARIVDMIDIWLIAKRIEQFTAALSALLEGTGRHLEQDGVEHIATRAFATSILMDGMRPFDALGPDMMNPLSENIQTYERLREAGIEPLTHEEIGGLAVATVQYHQKECSMPLPRTQSPPNGMAFRALRRGVGTRRSRYGNAGSDRLI